jgi:hypothetical protein
MGGRLVTDSTNDTRAVADPRALADVDRTETDAATGEESEHAIPWRKGYTVFKVGLHFGPFTRLPLESSFLQRLVEAATASFESCPVACKFAKRSKRIPRSPQVSGRRSLVAALRRRLGDVTTAIEKARNHIAGERPLRARSGRSLQVSF